jgi:hypothetical protein
MLLIEGLMGSCLQLLEPNNNLPEPPATDQQPHSIVSTLKSAYKRTDVSYTYAKRSALALPTFKPEHCQSSPPI